MFKAIKEAIWGRHDDEPQVVATHDIVEKNQITALLVQTFKAHTLLNASFSDSTELYNTTLLGIYDEYDFIVLDEINPKKGHRLLLEQKEILLNGRVDGVEMRFRCKLLEPREKNGISYYKMEMPQKIYFLQRRKDYRVSARGANIQFRAQGGQQNPRLINGYLNDLSRSGAGITVNELVDLNKGDIIPTCKITLPDGGEAIFSLQVCFCWRDTSRGITRIGGRFEQIDRISSQKIRKLINEMQRAIAKRLHGT
ncbi:MAG: flagellar brake protein [Chromatiales bacterium]|nr:flagellar brake protein [Chromatiales bacterium]